MKKIILGLCASLLLSLNILSPVYAAGWDDAIKDSTTSIENNVQQPFTLEKGDKGVTATLIGIATKVIIPILIFAGIVMAMIGFYGLLSSDKEDTRTKSMNYIIWGVAGIIVMTSAVWLSNTLVTTFTKEGGQISGALTAQAIYNKLLFPFIKIVMYLVMGVLFLIAMGRAISLLTSAKEDGGKAIGTIIGWNAVGIIIIIFAKELIEAIYGKQEAIINQQAGGILEDKSLPFVYTVINWITGFIGIALVILIIVQAIQLLTNPTDEGIQKKLRRNIIYMAIGIAIIGTSYVVTNFLIVR